MIMKKGVLLMENFKYIIIGFGKGGKTLAKTLATKKEQVLVIEQDETMYGGTCINIGCIPSKKLITQAQKQIPLETASENKQVLISALRNKNYHMIADEETAQVWNGTARFLSNYELEVQLIDGTVKNVKGEYIFINTGARSVIPTIKGLDATASNVLTSTEALNLKSAPKRLAIIGAGYIGLEFASMFNKFGSQVTVIDSFEQFIPREDPEIAHLVRQDLTNAGIDIHLGVKNLTFRHHEAEIEITYNDTESIQADYVLLATGRTPNTAALGLENTDITVLPTGAIQVDEYLKTSVPNVWAIGDVKGGPQFTYVSLDDFRIIADQLFGTGERTVNDRTLIPYTVFITPALSNVGINEEQAKTKGLNYKVFKLPVANIPKAHILDDTRGLFKVIVDADTNLILGASLYGVESQEIINIITLAMQANIPYTVLKNQIFTHPTMSESLNDLFK